MITTSEFDGLAAEFQTQSQFTLIAIFVSGGWGCLLSMCYMTLYKVTSPTSITIAVSAHVPYPL
jgi:hypothetical protein